MLEKIKRVKQSLKNEDNPDVILTSKAIISGMTNFYLDISSANKKAKERFENFCKECEYNKEETINTMKVKDNSIPELSDRMCSHCGGCVLSYKLRQSIKPCEFWK